MTFVISDFLCVCADCWPKFWIHHSNCKRQLHCSKDNFIFNLNTTQLRGPPGARSPLLSCGGQIYYIVPSIKLICMCSYMYICIHTYVYMYIYISFPLLVCHAFMILYRSCNPSLGDSGCESTHVTTGMGSMNRYQPLMLLQLTLQFGYVQAAVHNTLPLCGLNLHCLQVTAYTAPEKFRNWSSGCPEQNIRN